MPVADEARLQGQEAACLGEMKSEQDFPWSLEVAGEEWHFRQRGQHVHSCGV